MIYGLKNTVWENIFSCFDKYKKIDEVVLYGSRAMGTYKPASDIDLTLKSDKLTFKDQIRLENDLDDLLLPWKFDISLYHQLRNPELKDHINRVGIIIYKQSEKSKYNLIKDPT